MSSMAMDARKQRILEAIVALYANDGEPVGSGLLANYFVHGTVQRDAAQ